MGLMMMGQMLQCPLVRGDTALPTLNPLQEDQPMPVSILMTTSYVEIPQKAAGSC